MFRATDEEADALSHVEEDADTSDRGGGGGRIGPWRRSRTCRVTEEEEEADASSRRGGR